MSDLVVVVVIVALAADVIVIKDAYRWIEYKRLFSRWHGAASLNNNHKESKAHLFRCLSQLQLHATNNLWV